MAAYLVIFLLFFLPLIVIPIGISPFETPKVIVAEVLIEILLFVKIFQSKLSLKSLIHPNLLFVGILFILSLDTQLIFKPSGAFFGNLFRLQGQFLLWHLLLFSLLIKHISLYHIPKILYHLSFTCLVAGAIILGVLNGRAFGTLGEPNALSATILFMFPFVWFHSNKLLKTTSILTTLAVILLSGSRAGLIGFLVEMTFLILINLKVSLSKSTIICILISLSSLILPFLGYQVLFENRSEIWQTAFQAGLISPFLGQGFGSIQKVIHDQAIILNNTVQYQVVDSAHNFLLDYWIEGGIVGVISILMLIFLAFQHFTTHKKLLETTAFLGLTAAMLFNPVSVVNLLAFWWLIGQGN